MSNPSEIPIPKLSPTLNHPKTQPLQEISDPIYRTALAFDTQDETLLESALTKDVKFSLIPLGISLDGLEEIKVKSFRPVSKLITMHFLLNVRVNVHDEGDDQGKAKLTCSALAQHIRPGKEFQVSHEDKYTTGGLYFCDLVKVDVDGLWKIKDWEARILWTEGNRKVITG